MPGKRKKSSSAASSKKKAKTTAEGTHVLEQGRIVFFYRPKVGLKEAHKYQDVQKFYILLAPHHAEQHEEGESRLPKTKSHEEIDHEEAMHLLKLQGKEDEMKKLEAEFAKTVELLHQVKEATSSEHSEPPSEAAVVGDKEAKAEAKAAATEMKETMMKEKESEKEEKPAKESEKEKEEAEKEEEETTSSSQTTRRSPRVTKSKKVTTAATKKTKELPYRLFVVGAKMMPAPGSHSKSFMVLTKVTHDIEEIDKDLMHYQYSTKTRGQRELACARVVGEGLYEIVEHNRGKADHHSNLVYEVEFPHEMGPCQKAFHLQKEGSIILQVRNPHKFGDQTFQGTSKPAEYPQKLMKKFVGKRVAETRFARLDTTEFLNYEGCELFMYAVNKDASVEFGEVVKHLEEEAEQEAAQIDKSTDHHPEKQVMKEMHAEKKELDTKPMETGKFD